MRALLFAPLAVAVFAASGVALMSAMGRDPHLAAMVNAACTCLVAVALGAAPLVLARRAAQDAMTQAGLIATMVHLFAAVGIATTLMFAGRLSIAYTFWLIPFYFATLVPLVVAVTRAIKHAPPAPTTTTAAATPKA
jgi:hypothetical protein